MIPPLLQAAIDAHNAEYGPPKLRAPLPAALVPGDVVVAQADGRRAVVLITGVADDLRGCYRIVGTHSTPELAYEASTVIPQGVAAPWPCVVEWELYGYATHDQIVEQVGHVDLPGLPYGFFEQASMLAEVTGGHVGQRLAQASSADVEEPA